MAPKDIADRRGIRGFCKQDVRNPSEKQAITHFYNIYSLPGRACGFKIKFPRQFDLFPDIIDELASLGPSLKIIVLTRNNLIKQAISRQNMLRIVEATDRAAFHFEKSLDPKVKEKLVSTKFVVDIPMAIRYAKRLKKQKDKLLTFAMGFQKENHSQMLSIDYESLVAAPDQTLSEILNFLTVDPSQQLSSFYEKSTPDRLSTCVKNFDELVRQVNETEFRDQISEDD